ncbi:hypothetical protein GO496_13845 [Acidovorax citrulli]|nr:hypothetical protein [Paracidovorax citrulli]MVT29112.1 hypothetical protein [Paracidovorax citrulli]MVT37091.1 hypothetical protein [Paracidovorax citrulli]
MRRLKVEGVDHVSPIDEAALKEVQEHLLDVVDKGAHPGGRQAACTGGSFLRPHRAVRCAADAV